MEFKKWIISQEDVNLGGLVPPPEDPLATGIKQGNAGAFNTFTTDKSDLPPTPKHPKMKKAMKKG